MAWPAAGETLAHEVLKGGAHLQIIQLTGLEPRQSIQPRVAIRRYPLLAQNHDGDEVDDVAAAIGRDTLHNGHQPLKASVEAGFFPHLARQALGNALTVLEPTPGK